MDKTYFVFGSEYKGQDRVYIMNTETAQVALLNIGQDKLVGSTELIRRYQNTLILKHMEYNKPARILAVTLNSLEFKSPEEVTAASNLTIQTIEENSFEHSSEFGKSFAA